MIINNILPSTNCIQEEWYQKIYIKLAVIGIDPMNNVARQDGQR
jgi:hypothetical protein